MSAISDKFVNKEERGKLDVQLLGVYRTYIGVGAGPAGSLTACKYFGEKKKLI